MKKLKLYEDYIESMFKYNIGDYVLVNNQELWHIFPVVKIIDKNSNSKKTHNSGFEEKEIETERPEIDYYVETFLKNTQSRLDHFWLDEYEIDRKATEKEIQQYEMIKSAILYNL